MPAQTTQPPEDGLAASLRGFGPLGILAILVIILTGNVVVGKMVVLPIGAIFMLMCAHTAFDLTALAIIYWDLEAEVAHFLFK